MGLVWNQRGSRNETNTKEGLPVSTGAVVPKKRWSNLMPLFVALVVIAEIAFLGRLDMAKNAAMVADLFYRSRVAVAAVEGDDLGLDTVVGDPNLESESCEKWLEREDAVTYSRDFAKEPIFVSGGDQVCLFFTIFIFFFFFLFYMLRQN